MINLKSLICEAKVPKISLQQALDAKLFGPVYHGTNEARRTKIDQEGFKVFIGLQQRGDTAHGYDFEDYFAGIPAPIHHLGFGIYFTTNKAIAKQYSFGTMKGMKVYFLNVPQLETINFGAPRTMMKWWRQNGYDFKPPYDTNNYKDVFFGGKDLLRVNYERLKATVNMTDELKSKYDAVWFKGKGIYRLLDGDQVCVYEPEGKIFEVDLSLAKGFEAGAKVRAKREIFWSDREGSRYGTAIPAGTIGIIKKKDPVGDEWKTLWSKLPNHWAADVDKYILTVKWKKGGEKQATDTSVEPLSQ